MGHEALVQDSLMCAISCAIAVDLITHTTRRILRKPARSITDIRKQDQKRLVFPFEDN